MDDMRKAWVRCIIALQFTVPGVLLINRLATGDITHYGWGWQMFTFG